MKTGWLVVNGFLRTEKFNTLYALLLAEAEKLGMDLRLKYGDELTLPLGERPRETPDFVLFWDKDIPLARRLRKLAPVFNAPRAIELCDSKIRTAEALTEAGIKTPRTAIAPKTFEGVGYTRTDFLDALGYPVVIKEAYGSFGAQVYLARDRAEAEAIVKKIGHKEFILQEFIAASAGRDIRANVVGGKVVAAMLRYNENDFRSNITNGGKARSVTLTAAQEELAIAAAEALGLDFAGVDILLGEEPLVCEVNSNPSFQSTLVATGVNVGKYIMEHIYARMVDLR